MPYIVRSEDFLAEEWKEPNKDEVIDRLIWLLRRMEMEINVGGRRRRPQGVEYPDGSVW